jgi:hypothetical protein
MMEGVAYFLNTDYLEMPMSEAPNISEFKERVGDQDVVTALFSMQANLICTKLVAQGTVTGGGIGGHYGTWKSIQDVAY